MPEGLKNTGATIARMTIVVLGPQLQRNIIAYVDDIVVMSKSEENHIADLKETFTNLRGAGLKLNPKKCIFRVSKGKMLGYIISAKGIRANPDKTKAIISMVEPSTEKEVQKLTGRIAALNRFISKLAERSLPFFKALSGADKLVWGPEQSEAFRQLKNYMATNLVVIVPEPEAPLLLYVAGSDRAVSGVLVHEIEEGSKVIQRPVYFVSEALLGAKLNYTEVEKIAYAILTSSRKLKHYFQAHKITVSTSQPLGDILRNKEASGRIGKWATELSQFEITYAPRTTIKSQALADFMADWAPSAQSIPQPVIKFGQYS
jgi:acetolactate synthase small subunit